MFYVTCLYATAGISQYRLINVTPSRGRGAVADEVIVKEAFVADKVVAEAAFAEDWIVAKTASVADEAVGIPVSVET